MQSMVKVGLLALLLATFGSTNCQQCSDLSNEKMSVSSCQDRDWRTSAGYDQDQSVACKACTQGLNDIAIALGRNDDEDSIKKTLYDNCSLITDQSLRGECQRLVTQYMDEIKDVVKRAVNRWVVCGMLKMCQNMSESSGGQSARNPLLQNLAMDSDNSPNCSSCQKFVSHIKDSMSKADLMTPLQRSLYNDICGKITPTADSSDTPEQCMPFITNSLPILQKTVADLINPQQLCQDALFCSRSSSSDGQNKYSTLCTNLVNVVEQNEQIIGSAIKSQICKYLSNRNAQTICTQANLNLAAANFVDALFDAINLVTKCNNAVQHGYYEIDSLNQLSDQQTTTAAAGTNLFCTTCSWIVQQFDQLYVEQPSLPDNKIPGYFDQYSNQIPSTVGSLDTCNEFRRRTDLAYLSRSDQRSVLCSRIGC